MQALSNDAQINYECVIVDTSPPSACADAATLR